MASIDITERKRDKVVILEIKGLLFAEAGRNLQVVARKHLNKDCQGLILDLSGLAEEFVSTIDSVGLGAVKGIFEDFAKQGKRVVLLNVGRYASHLLVITKLDQMFEKYDDEDEAVESFEEKEEAPVV